MLRLVEVTDVDIKNGVSRCTVCPIALATKRVVNPSVVVKVGLFCIEFESPQNWAIINQEDDVHAFRSDFDLRRTVEPARFMINIPEWAL